MFYFSALTNYQKNKTFSPLGTMYSSTICMQYYYMYTIFLDTCRPFEHVSFGYTIYTVVLYVCNTTGHLLYFLSGIVRLYYIYSSTICMQYYYRYKFTNLDFKVQPDIFFNSLPTELVSTGFLLCARLVSLA